MEHQTNIKLNTIVLHIQLLVMSPLKKKKALKRWQVTQDLISLFHLISNPGNDSNNIYKVGVEFWSHAILRKNTAVI